MKKTRPKLIYLASPYSHDDSNVMNYREQQINSIAAHLYAKHKVSVIPPIMISAVIKRELGSNIGTSFKEWAAIDFRYIEACDEVWVACMDGWQESIGVTAEIKFANNRNIKVKFVNPTTCKFIKCPKN